MTDRSRPRRHSGPIGAPALFGAPVVKGDPLSRLLIVSRIVPGTEEQLAAIVAESDAAGLPALTGVRHRSLYCLRDVFVHLVETDLDPGALAEARVHPLHLDLDERLAAHTLPYLPDRQSPRDAVAGCFYHWDTATAPSPG